MRKLLLAASALALVATFTSCKKDHTCECTTTFDDTSMPTQTVSYTFKETKSKAKDACNTKVVTVTGAKMECKLK